MLFSLHFSRQDLLQNLVLTDVTILTGQRSSGLLASSCLLPVWVAQAGNTSVPRFFFFFCKGGKDQIHALILCLIGTLVSE